MKFRNEPTYSFDDVLLVPQHSDIPSRQCIDISTQLGSLKLKLPLLSANMDTVTEFDMAFAMGRAGGAGVLHRFAPIKEQMVWVRECGSNLVPAIISVGVQSGEARKILKEAYDEHYSNPGLDAICVDVAHGDHARVIGLVTIIRDMYPDLDIIAGNVATGLAALRLVHAGANIIKVGIGPGSVCSTRVVTGHGFPQFSAIIDVKHKLSQINQPTYIIADGGIRYPGDIVKALAAGADAVMLGSLVAGTDEAPGVRIIEHDVAYKIYRGMASREVQSEKKAGGVPRVEGVSAKVPYRGPVRDTLDNLEAGIRSGFSYSGANNLSELRDRAEFVVVTGNTLKENHPHHPYRL